MTDRHTDMRGHRGGFTSKGKQERQIEKYINMLINRQIDRERSCISTLISQENIASRHYENKLVQKSFLALQKVKRKKKDSQIVYFPHFRVLMKNCAFPQFIATHPLHVRKSIILLRDLFVGQFLARQFAAESWEGRGFSKFLENYTIFLKTACM